MGGALNIKTPDEERLAEGGAKRLARFLETEVWPRVPEAERGRRLSRAAEDAAIGIRSGGRVIFDTSAVVAVVTQEPLLCTGNDFAQTDLELA